MQLNDDYYYVYSYYRKILMITFIACSNMIKNNYLQKVRNAIFYNDPHWNSSVSHNIVAMHFSFVHSRSRIG